MSDHGAWLARKTPLIGPATAGCVLSLLLVLPNDARCGAPFVTDDPGTVATNYQRFPDAVRSGVQAEPSFRHAAELQKVLDLAVLSDEKRAELRASADTQ